MRRSSTPELIDERLVLVRERRGCGTACSVLAWLLLALLAVLIIWKF